MPIKYTVMRDSMEKNSKIYIAGHRGLVGSAIHRRLQAEGYTNIICRTSSELDLTKQADVEKFFNEERPEYVVLAAAKVGGIIANSKYPADFIYRNLMISTNIINSCYLYGVKKLVNLGSSCIYPRMAQSPIKEEYLLTGAFEPTNEAYALAKVSALKMCDFYNRQYGTNFISLMPTNLFGENDNFNMETAHLLPMVLRRFHLAKHYDENNIEAIKHDLSCNPIGWGLDDKINSMKLEDILEKIGISKGKVKLWGNGSVYRELMSSNQLADAVLYFLKNIDYKDINGFVNITSGQDIKLSDLFEIVKNISGYRGEIEYDTSMPNGMPRKLMDSAKLFSLGWKPEYNLEKDIKEYYNWYLSKFMIGNFSVR